MPLLDSILMGPGRQAVVALHGELRRLAPGLQEALGTSYSVLPAAPARGADAIIVPARLSLLDRCRAESRHVLVVVYDTVGHDPTPYLEATADDYVARCSMLELAARVRAGLRRLGAVPGRRR